MQAAPQARRNRPTISLPAPPVTVAALDAAADADPAAALTGRVELLDGLCVLRPWPTPLRTRVTQALAAQLSAAAPSGAHVFPPGASLLVSARTLVVPDLVVGPLPAALPPPANRVEERPFLVVEVADENTRRLNRTFKLEVYRERGIPSVWLVDPDPATATMRIEVHDLVDGAYARAADVAGSTPLTVTHPFPVTVVPADLVDPGDPGD